MFSYGLKINQFPFLLLFINTCIHADTIDPTYLHYFFINAEHGPWTNNIVYIVSDYVTLDGFTPESFPLIYSPLCLFITFLLTLFFLFGNNIAALKYVHYQNKTQYCVCCQFQLNQYRLWFSLSDLSLPVSSPVYPRQEGLTGGVTDGPLRSTRPAVRNQPTAAETGL